MTGNQLIKEFLFLQRMNFRDNDFEGTQQDILFYLSRSYEQLQRDYNTSTVEKELSLSTDQFSADLDDITPSGVNAYEIQYISFQNGSSKHRYPLEQRQYADVYSYLWSTDSPQTSTDAYCWAFERRQEKPLLFYPAASNSTSKLFVHWFATDENGIEDSDEEVSDLFIPKSFHRLIATHAVWVAMMTRPTSTENAQAFHQTILQPELEKFSAWAGSINPYPNKYFGYNGRLGYNVFAF